MKRARHRLDDYRYLVQVGGCITQRLARMYFTGKPELRHRRTEWAFPKLEKKNEVVPLWHEGEMVYFARRLCRGTQYLDLVDHYLGAAECVIRMWRANMTGIFVPQSEFHDMGSIPDQAVIFDKSLLLIEFHTYHNFRRHKVEQKVAAYTRHLSEIEGDFKRGAIVIFVIDALKEEIHELNVSDDSCYFVDFNTFKSVPIGQQLSAPIYLWGGDGQPYPLRNVQPD